MTDPTETQLAEFLATDQSSSVVFINCHRYYPEAKYTDDYNNDRYPTNVSGHEAYHRYFKEVSSRFVPKVGGQLILVGPVEMVFIGEDNWDEVVIGHYPSKADALRMSSISGYDDIAIHREAGLESVETMVLEPANLAIFNFA